MQGRGGPRQPAAGSVPLSSRRIWPFSSPPSGSPTPHQPSPRVWVTGRREGCHRAPLFLACARPPACPPSQPWCAARRRHRGLLLCRLSGCVLTPQGEALNLPPSSPPSPRGDRGCGQDPSWRPHRPQATAVSEAAGPRGWVCGPGFTTVQAAWLTTCPLTRGGQELPAHIPARALHWWERRRDRQARTRSPGQSGGERLLHLPSRPKRTG